MTTLSKTTLRRAGPGDSVGRTARGDKGRRRRSPSGSGWTPYLFLAPGLALFAVVQALPLLQEARLSLTRTALTSPNDNAWVGLDNFVEIFASADFKRTLVTTGIYLAVCVLGAVGVGLVVALLLNGNYRGRGVARAVVTVPWAAPGVAVALVMTWMLNAQYGIVNRALGAVGLAPPGGAILESPKFALPAILVITVWQLFPFNAVVLLSALQSVPKEVTEAAMMDGASTRWIFRVATWPVIAPTVSLLTVLNAVWAIRRFDLIWVTTKGGPVGATETLVIDLYSNAFELGNLGKAAAMGVVGVVISLVLVGASMLLSRRSDQGDAR